MPPIAFHQSASLCDGFRTGRGFCGISSTEKSTCGTICSDDCSERGKGAFIPAFIGRGPLRLTQMTPKERAIAALTLKQPDQVPTFELEFQLTQELLGKEFNHNWRHASQSDRQRICRENAELYVEIAERLEYSIIMICRGGEPDEQALIETAAAVKDLTGDKYLLVCHGDGTFAIPSGDNMVELAYWFHDKPGEVHEQAERMARAAIERNRRLLNAGFDGFALCADYCFNSGPFLSPQMFAEFVQPYLTRIIADIRENNGYAIKHTDGDIMPIIDQLVDAKPHALHSLDPMAGVDIKQVKERYGDRVCLIGNVNCALLQTGTREEIIQDATYSIQSGKPGGGYIYSTSNVAFKGMPLENYLLIHDIWKKYRDY